MAKKSMTLEMLDLGPAEKQQFIDDLRFLTSDEGMHVARQCLGPLPIFLQAEIDSKRRTLLQSLANELRLPFVPALQAFRSLAYLAGEILSEDLTPDGLESDRERIAKLLGDPENFDNLVSLVRMLNESRGELLEASYTRKQVIGVLPLFTGCRGTVDARISWDDSNTEVEDLLPIASVLINCDSGNPQSFAFQASEAGIDEMLGLLKQIKDRMEKTRCDPLFRK